MTQSFSPAREAFPILKPNVPPVRIRASTGQERELPAYWQRREPAPLSGTDNELLTQARRVVEMHLDDPHFGVQELADALFMSRSQLHRRMVRATGESAGHFIRCIRLEHARRLLARTGCSIADVAYSCGFADPAYFSRSFRRVWGQSPTTFRESGQRSP